MPSAPRSGYTRPRTPRQACRTWSGGYGSPERAWRTPEREREHDRCADVHALSCGRGLHILLAELQTAASVSGMRWLSIVACVALGSCATTNVVVVASTPIAEQHATRAPVTGTWTGIGHQYDL